MRVPEVDAYASLLPITLYLLHADTVDMLTEKMITIPQTYFLQNNRQANKI